jgi:hypothetical protein
VSRGLGTLAEHGIVTFDTDGRAKRNPSRHAIHVRTLLRAASQRTRFLGSVGYADARLARGEASNTGRRAVRLTNRWDHLNNAGKPVSSPITAPRTAVSRLLIGD